MSKEMKLWNDNFMKNAINTMHSVLGLDSYHPWPDYIGGSSGMLSLGTWNNREESEIVHENDKILVRLEVPGYSSEDIQVELSEGMLIISGKKEETSKFRTQRMSFSQSFVVGKDILAEQTSAEVKDGVLTVTIPKKEPEPKTLPPVHKVQVK